jgi:integrase/recombinase XerD
MEQRNWSAQTVATYGFGVRDFLRFLESQAVDGLGALHRGLVESYRQDLFVRRVKGRPLAVSTQAARLTAVKSFLRFLAQENVLLLDVGGGVDLPKKPQTLPRVLSEEEVVRLLESPDAATLRGIRDRALLEVLYCTAARSSEVGSFLLADVDWELPALHIRLGKGQKDRCVPLGEEALAWLEEYLARVRPAWLRHSEEWHLFLTSQGRPLTRSALADIVKTYTRPLGWREVTAHTLRHSAATHMLRRGANVRHLQQMLGHSSLQTTSHYTQVDLKDLQKALRRYHPRERRP